MMAFGAGVNEDNDWLQVEGMACSFCRESKKNEPGSRRASKLKTEKTAEARSANDCQLDIHD